MLKTTISRSQSQGGNAWRRLGKIKLGKKVANSNGSGDHPVDLDYFVIPDKYKELLGAEPKEISIVLANARLEENFNSRAVMYYGNGSKGCHTDDDVTARRYMQPDGKSKYEWVTMECPNVNCKFRQEGKCKERGYFNFMIPESGEVGIFLIIMGTKVGISQIYTALKMVETYCATRPQGMAGIRMKLRRERVEFYQDIKGSGQQAKIVKYIPMVELDFQQLLHDDQVRLGPILGQKALAAPPKLTYDESEDLTDHEERDDAENLNQEQG